jgi:hypothetical protein
VRALPPDEPNLRVQTSLEAAARGDIKLPAMSGRQDNIKIYKSLPLASGRDSSNEVKYTELSIAKALGWTVKHRGNGEQPNTACRVAFDALLAIDGKRSF